jgi:hypothetical protein
MKTATSGHGTIAERLRRVGLAYEITNVMQIATFLTTGGPWVAVAQYDQRVFCGFYTTREDARTARNAARRRRGVTSTRVIHIPNKENQ